MVNKHLILFILQKTLVFFRHLRKTGFFNQKICIVTDKNVDHYYGNQLLSLLQTKYNVVYKYVFAPGEENKNLKTIYNMYDFS